MQKKISVVCKCDEDTSVSLQTKVALLALIIMFAVAGWYSVAHAEVSGSINLVETYILPDTRWSANVQKIYDTDTGATCYVYRRSGISCIK